MQENRKQPHSGVAEGGSVNSEVNEPAYAMPKRCVYLYRDGDLKVKKGEYKVGQRCKGFQSKTGKYHSYCYYHYQTLYKKGELKLVGSERAEMAAKMERAVENKKKADEKSKKNKEKDNSTAKKYLFHLGKLAGDGFDATAAWDSVKELNPLPSVVDGCEKYLFALWLASPVNSREPADMAGFADLVGISVGKLNLWKYSDTVYKLYEEQTEHFMRQYRHVVNMILLSKVMAGDMGAINRYYDEFKVGDEGKKNNKKDPKAIENLYLIQQAAFLEAEKVMAGNKVGRLQTESGKKVEGNIMQKLMKGELRLGEGEVPLVDEVIER